MSAGRGFYWRVLVILIGLQVQSVHGQSILRLSDAPSHIQNGSIFDINDKKPKVDPKRATIMSAIIPGLGQIYNEKYWKVGVIYTAGFVMGYGMKYNVDSLRRYQNALNARVDTSSATIDTRYPHLTDAKVTDERNYYRRNRDMLILGFVGVYALQIIDANVDAHLREFELNKDLTLKITPDVGLWRGNQLRTGISFKLTF